MAATVLTGYGRDTDAVFDLFGDEVDLTAALASIVGGQVEERTTPPLHPSRKVQRRGVTLRREPRAGPASVPPRRRRCRSAAGRVLGQAAGVASGVFGRVTVLPLPLTVGAESLGTTWGQEVAMVTSSISRPAPPAGCVSAAPLRRNISVSVLYSPPEVAS